MVYPTTQEMQAQDAYAAAQQQAQEQARAAEEGRRKNIEILRRMFLSLGADAITVANSTHDGELAEAKALAAGEWSRLLDLEAQVVREEANLNARPRRRPAAPSDKMLAREVIERMDEEYEADTKHRRESLAQEKALAVATRKDLESYIVKSKR
jgi:hypothetical protein